MDAGKLLLLLFLSVAVGTDLCQGKVYNRWMIAGAGFANVWTTWQIFQRAVPWYLLVERLLGMVVPALILFPLFSLKVIGGGDVKLYSMIGAFVGFKGCLQAMALALVPAGVFALAKLLIKWTFGKRFGYLKFYFQKLLLSGVVTVYEEEHTEEGSICLSVPIMIGVWLYLWECWKW